MLRILCSEGYQQTKTVELQQRSSSVATQQTTVSSVPSHPSTTGVSRILHWPGTAGTVF